MDALPPALVDFLTPANIATVIIAVNFAAFAAFGIDKARAERGAWRISEGALLRLAFLGGTPGAYAGRALFRHKTRKQPFSGRLHTIAILQVVGMAALAGWLTFGDELGLAELLARMAERLSDDLQAL
jgi:uncharacterized membrane protein YsdA (DUF1294 family)